ncbi:MAG: hypothetical protein HY964_03910 [Ignavibacteriales bacterium]|nr:hypothetical protein [Ignavibacteriales bacterium]
MNKLFPILLSSLFLIISCREYSPVFYDRSANPPTVTQLKNLNEQFNTNIYSLAFLSPSHLLAGGDSGVIHQIKIPFQLTSSFYPAGHNGRIVNILCYDSTSMIIQNSSSGLFYSSNKGNTWSNISDSLNPDGISSVYLIGKKLFIGTYQGLIYRSSIDGSNFQLVGNLIRPITSFTASDSTVLFAGTWSDGVYRIDISSNSISQISAGLLNRYILSLHCDGQGNLFAGTYNGGIYLIKNGSSHWQNYSAFIDSISINSIATDLKSAVFAISDRKLFGFKYGLINFESELDNSNLLFNFITYNSNNIYIGTTNGIYFCSTSNQSKIKNQSKYNGF